MWHYLRDEETVGPVSEGGLETLIEEGTVRPETYVWHEGLADWQPAGSIESLQARFPTTPAALMLRQGRRVYADPDAAAGEAITIDSMRAPLASLAEAENTAPESGLMGWMIFTSPFEFRLFMFTALLAGIATGVVHFVEPRYLLAPFVLQGLLCSALGSLIFRWRTFQAGLFWGIGGIFVGVTDLFFLILHWDRARASFLLGLAGLAVLVGVYAAVLQGTPLVLPETVLP